MTLTSGEAAFLRRAIELAVEARTRGDEPFGAVLAHKGEIVLEARNAIHSESDPTQHAEIRLVAKASRSLGASVLAESTLYASTEPCSMCLGAIRWARIPRVVYGFSASDLEDLVRGAPEFEFSRPSVTGPELANEAFEPHRGYWPNS